MKKAGQFESITIIDMSGWFSIDNHSRKMIAEEVRNACLTSGFMYLKNHGISQDVIADAKNASEDFFSLPQETKLILFFFNIAILGSFCFV